MSASWPRFIAPTPTCLKCGQKHWQHNQGQVDKRRTVFIDRTARDLHQDQHNPASGMEAQGGVAAGRGPLRALERFDLHNSCRTGEFYYGAFWGVFIQQLQQSRMPQISCHAQGIHTFFTLPYSPSRLSKSSPSSSTGCGRSGRETLWRSCGKPYLNFTRKFVGQFWPLMVANYLKRTYMAF